MLHLIIEKIKFYFFRKKYIKLNVLNWDVVKFLTLIKLNLSLIVMWGLGIIGMQLER